MISKIYSTISWMTKCIASTSSNADQKKSVVLSLSKEDRAPFLYNVRVSELSLFARAWYHTRKTYTYPQKVNKADAFIVSCGQNSRFALSIMEEQIEELRQKKSQRTKNLRTEPSMQHHTSNSTRFNRTKTSIHLR